MNSTPYLAPSDFDITPGLVCAEVERSGGRSIYRSSRAKSAHIGNGGPELTFETLNGSIRLHREQ